VTTSPADPPAPHPDGAIPLVRVVRNGLTECVHHGSLVITAPDGSVLSAIGDVTSPVFPRSSNKPFQAATSLACGSGLSGADLALSAASHSGEPEHVRRVLGILAGAGLSEDDLGCPPDLPLDDEARHAVVAAGGGPARRYMNCSGKHAGMLAACVASGWDTASYLEANHPLQQAVAGRITDLSGEVPATVGVDGCGAPLFALSLAGLARAFGRAAAAPAGSVDRTVTDAMRAHPFLVAGTGRDDTLLMRAHPGLLVKGGAEGVHCAALADGTAIALKVSDGASRARMPLLTAALAHLGLASESLDELAASPVLGGGRPVGVTEVIPGALAW
jgi:L-asparaginase II